MRGLFLIGLLVLGGCSSFSEETSDAFAPGTASPEQFSRDSAACEMSAGGRQSMDGMGGMAGIAQYYASYNKVYDPCMRAKGYQHKY